MGVLRDREYLELNADVQRIFDQSVRVHRYDEGCVGIVSSTACISLSYYNH